MRALYAWLTILAALLVGIAGGNLLVRGVSPVLEVAAPCLWLAEAEKAGHLPLPKRTDLVDRLSKSQALDQKGRDIAARLAVECPKLAALRK